jgi:glycosyltransferase involved in cell wall biosynthesis
MKISWQTRSKLLRDSLFLNRLESGANGGNIYDFHAAQALRYNNEVKAYDKAVWQNDNPFSYWLKLRAQPNADISVLEPYPAVFGSFSRQQKYIAMVHHIDFNRINNSFKHKLFFDRLLKRLKRTDKVVTVSRFWQKYLEDKGCKNVHVIYNSFDVENYKFDKQELEAYKKQLGFDNTKPLVHIGNASAEKGVYEAYEALKGLNIQLVMTGGSNRAKDLPVPFFSLPDPEYRKLLASCDTVVAFSLMTEGWNRIAHETMLCKVPVVGSGVGGMQELLDGGKQLCARNKEELKEKVGKAIRQKNELGNLGYLYASQFDMAYFNRAWLDLVDDF